MIYKTKAAYDGAVYAAIKARAKTDGGHMFQQRHYEAIAEVIKHLRYGTDREHDKHMADRVAMALSTLFTEDNPNYDQDRFYRACGVYDD